MDRQAQGNLRASAGRAWPRRRRQAGLSLVEILIALAVFVIGILAVIRIFPRALDIMTTVGDRGEATRIAQARLNDLQTVEERLPDMILPAGRPTDVTPGNVGSPNPGFGFLRLPAGADLARPFDFDPIPAMVDPDDPGLLHRLARQHRLVVGEKVIVPAPTPTGIEPYLSLFGPLAEDPTAAGRGDVVAFREFRRVQPGELLRTDAGGAFRDRPVFAFADGGIDDFTGAPAPDRLLLELDSTPRLLSIRLAFRQTDGLVRWMQLPPRWVPEPAYGEAVVTPGGLNLTPYFELVLGPPWIPQPLVSVVPDSIEVRQVMDRVSGLPGRFEFSDTGPGGNLGGWDSGVLWFPSEQAGESLSLEYVVDDWRNLREAHTVPVDASGAINLPGNLLQLNSDFVLEAYQPIIVDVGTGTVIPVDTGQWGPNLAGGGRVPLGGASLPGSDGDRELLVYYRRDDAWAVAPSVAPVDYLSERDAAAQTPSGQAVDYSVQNTIVEIVSSGQAGYSNYLDLRFRPSEAGRVVAVTYEVNLPGGGRELVTGELHVIPPRPNAVSSSGQPRHAVRLDRPDVATEALTGVPLIHRIEGRSLQVRVLYDDEVIYREMQAPDFSPPVAGTQYGFAERMVEVAAYINRQR